MKVSRSGFKPTQKSILTPKVADCDHKPPRRVEGEGMKVRDLMEKRGAINKILQKELPFKLSYRLSRILNKVIAEYKTIEATRQEMFKKYGEETKDKSLKIPDKNLKAFGKEWDAVLDEEIKFTVEKIPQECLEPCNLNAIDISNIMEFIEEPKKEKK